MPSRSINFPVFDADNHMYETTEAFTKFLPPEYNKLIQYVQVGKRTKIESLEITWPSGQVDRLTNVPADQIMAVKEGAGIVPHKFPTFGSTK